MRVAAVLLGLALFAGLVVLAVAGVSAATAVLVTAGAVVAMIGLGNAVGGRHTPNRSPYRPGTPTDRPGDEPAPATRPDRRRDRDRRHRECGRGRRAVSLYRDEGVVLRTLRLGEADRIVTMITKGHGKVRAVAKGVRRTKSKFGARLEPLSHVTLLCWQGRELDIVNQAEVTDTFRAVREDLGPGGQGLHRARGRRPALPGAPRQSPALRHGGGGPARPRRP